MDNIRSSRYRKLLGNVGTLAVGNIFTKVAQYATVALCTYNLTTAEFGLADTLIQTASMIVPIATLDISEGMFRFASSDESIFSLSMLVNAIAAGVVIVGSPIAMNVLGLDANPITLASLCITQAILLSTKEFVRGTGNTQDYMRGGVINSFCQIMLCLVLVRLIDIGVSGYIASICIANCIEIAFLFAKLSLFDSIIRSGLSRKKAIVILRYSLPLVPNTVMWWVVAASDRYFVLHWCGAESTGLYAVAARFPALITILTGVFFQAWQISAIAEASSDERRRFYSNVFKTLWVLVAITTSIMLIFIRPLVSILVADSFAGAWAYAPLLLVAAAFNSLQSFFGVNYTVAKDSVGALMSTMLAAAANLLLNFLLIPRLGVQGATVSTAVSYLAVAVYRYFDTKRYISIDISPFPLMAATYMLLTLAASTTLVGISWYPMSSVAAFILILLLNKKTLSVFFYRAKSLVAGNRRSGK